MLEIESFLPLGSQLFGIVPYSFPVLLWQLNQTGSGPSSGVYHINAPVITQENQEDVTECL